MLHKIKNQSLIYQTWAVSIAIFAIYLLFKFFLSELSSVDRIINVYVWVSIVIDSLFFPLKEEKS